MPRADDLQGVEVLLMLNLDGGTSHIPVVTYIADPDSDADRTFMNQTMSMN